MANTVQANIEVNAKMNVDDIERGLKDIAKGFDDLGVDIEKYLSAPADMTIDAFKAIEAEATKLQSQFVSLKLSGVVDDETFKVASDELKDLTNRVQVFKNAWQSIDPAILKGFATDSLNIKDAITEDNNRVTEYKENIKSVANESSNVVNATTNQANAFKKEEESLDTLVARMGHYLKVQNDIANNDFNKILSQDFDIDGGKSLNTEELEAIRDSLKETDDKVKESENNLADYGKIIQTILQNLGLSSSEAIKFSKALGASATEAAAAGVAIGVIAGVLKIYVDRLHEAENALVKFGESALDAGVSGVEFFVDAIHTLVDSIEEALEKMQEFAEAGAEIQTAYYNTFTILGEEAGEQVLGFTEKLETLYGLDGDNLVKDMQSVIAAAGSLGVSTGDAVKATENMTLMAEDLSLIAGSFNKASNDIGNAISKGFVGRASSLYVLMTKAEKDELKSLGSEVERYNYLMSLSGRIKGRYIEFLGTEAGKVMLLRNQYEILVNNISKLALGLYAKIAPILTKLIQLANIALTYIMKVFNIDIKGGANIGGNNIADDIADSIGKVGDNAKTSGKAVDELKRKVASFDDVIQISDDKTDNGLDSELAELSDVDISGIWDLDDAVKNLNDDWSKFRELLNNRDYYGAGQEIAKWLKEQMEAIPWDSIQAKARKFGAAIAEVLNGIIEDKDVWADFGHTIAQALNTAVDLLLNFADLFNFRALGEGFGIAWKQFWDEFDEVEAAEALYEWFMGIFNVVGGFFSTDPLSTMASSLVGMFHNFFNNFGEEDKETIANTVKDILDDIFTAGVRLAEGALEDTDSIIEFINTILDSAIAWLNEGGDKKLEAIGDAIVGILAKLKESGVIGKIEKIIKEVMDDIKLGDILAAATDLAMDAWAAKMRIKLKLIWEEIKAVFKTLDIAGALKTFGDLVIAGFAVFIAYVWEAIKNLWDFGEALAYFVEAAKINLEAFFSAVLLLVVSGIMQIVDGIDGVKGNVIEQFNDIKAKVEAIFNPETWKKIGRDAFNGLFNGIKEIIQNIKDFINTHLIDKLNSFKITIPSNKLTQLAGIDGGTIGFNIPRLAVGGIVKGSTIANIGEAGREAILPLDRNTGWMDELASKINNSGGNVNNAPVVIDMSKAVKPVYTRSEYLAMADVFAEALKARGVVVSMEY